METLDFTAQSFKSDKCDENDGNWGRVRTWTHIAKPNVCALSRRASSRRRSHQTDETVSQGRSYESKKKKPSER